MEKILLKESVQRVENLIKKFDPELKILVLKDSARTAKNAADALKCETGAIVKSLLLKADFNFLVCLVAGDNRCSLNKVKNILKANDIRMANVDEVKMYTGFSIGGVSPVGHIKKMNIIIDKTLRRYQNVFAAAGNPNCVFKINYSQLIKITNGLEEEIIE